MITTLFLLIVLWGHTIYFLLRNNRVLKFRVELIDKCAEWSVRHIDEICEGREISAFDWFYPKLPSYNAMVFSFKPLTMENYFNPQDIEKINN